MTPQNLVTALLRMDEQEGHAVLQKQLPSFDKESQRLLVELIKREADKRWTTELQLSFVLAGHLIFIAELTRGRSAHALGLIARGDALRDMDEEVQAVSELDRAAEDFLGEGEDAGEA